MMRRARRKSTKRKQVALSARAAYQHISFASKFTMAMFARSRPFDTRDALEALGERFEDSLARIQAQQHPTLRGIAAEEFVEKLRRYGRPYTERDRVFFVYKGDAKRVSVPSDLNGWNSGSDTMRRVRGTNLFYLKKRIGEAARFEYKFAVDSRWMLDPLNMQQAMGGYGPNSEIWMPAYSPPPEIEYGSGIPHGTVDAFSIKSSILKRTHPVFAYTPPGYNKSKHPYPTMYVTDGGEYISLALMLNVLDNMIAEKRIQPIIAIFIDARTDVQDSETSKRMTDYMMNDRFVNFLISELRPKITRRYRTSQSPEQTAIMGASLGGLIATYAAYTRPDVFGLCAAQSPAYWMTEGAMTRMISRGPKKPIKISIDTGTIRDAQDEARRMKKALKRKRYTFRYTEHPESHNWVNWRARIAEILTFFWGKDPLGS